MGSLSVSHFCAQKLVENEGNPLFMALFDQQLEILDDFTFYRRNISDAEFDLMSGQHSTSSTSQAISSKSDLIPGVYEGGLKTWECAYDLSKYLASLPVEDWHSLASVLEVFSYLLRVDWMWCWVAWNCGQKAGQLAS